MTQHVDTCERKVSVHLTSFASKISAFLNLRALSKAGALCPAPQAAEALPSFPGHQTGRTVQLLTGPEYESQEGENWLGTVWEG